MAAGEDTARRTRGTKRRAQEAADTSDPEALRDEDEEHDTRPTKYTRASEPEDGGPAPAPSATETPPVYTEREGAADDASGVEAEDEDANESDRGAREPEAGKAPAEASLGSGEPEESVAPAAGDLGKETDTSVPGDLEKEDVSAKALDSGAEGTPGAKDDFDTDAPQTSGAEKSARALSMFGAGKRGQDEPEDEEEEVTPPRQPAHKAVAAIGSNPTPAMSPLAKSMTAKLSTHDPPSTSAGGSSGFTFGASSSKMSFSNFSGSVFGSGLASGAGTGASFGTIASSASATDFASMLSASKSSKGKAKEDAGKGDEDESDGDEGAEEAQPEFDADDYKPKIHLTPQEVVTGEEDENTIMQLRGKLFDFDEAKGTKGDWRERGVGLLRLNKKVDEETARLVMRMDGVLRVILNVNLFKNMTCTLVQEKFLRFVACETPGKLTTFLLKTSNPAGAAAMAAKIQALCT
ncbi:hypothetical protein DFJ74DRAFT_676779 [Hyaloraphidium curvatum]|nr:hypothetical protein DFJ74DRAFT_676779 [Hyaloraphidium curvatum]